MISRVRGTEDFLDLSLRQHLLDLTKKHLERYNFHEIQTPILEHTELFVHSLGQETDVVSKEMYVFHGEEAEKSICLRPEATASIIRACFENRVERFPWKVFLSGPMFRRERPQKGRYRQFSQFDMEVIGSSSIAQDAYFIHMLDALFGHVIKLENYVIKLNFLGCFDDRKRHRTQLKYFLDALKDAICETCLVRKEKNTLRIFDCKTELCQQLYRNAPRLTEFLCATCVQEWETLQHLLTSLSVSYTIDTSLVRGLDYYNKTVFEFVSSDLGSQNTFCGGGRYSLGREVGATEDYAAIGAAFGIERVVLLAELIQKKLMLPQPQALHVIIPLAEEQHTIALLLAAQLQAKNLCTDLVLEKASVSNMMKKANKMGAKYVLMIGSEEQQEGVVTIKNMQTGEPVKIKQTDAVAFLTNTTAV